MMNELRDNLLAIIESDAVVAKALYDAVLRHRLSVEEPHDNSTSVFDLVPRLEVEWQPVESQRWKDETKAIVEEVLK